MQSDGANAKASHILLHALALALRREDEGESVLSQVLMADSTGNVQGFRIAWQRDDQRHSGPNAQSFGHLHGQPVRADIDTSGIDDPRIGITDLQQQMEVSGKARHAVAEFLHSALVLIAHSDLISRHINFRRARWLPMR